MPPVFARRLGKRAQDETNESLSGSNLNPQNRRRRVKISTPSGSGVAPRLSGKHRGKYGRGPENRSDDGMNLASSTEVAIYENVQRLSKSDIVVNTSFDAEAPYVRYFLAHHGLPPSVSSNLLENWPKQKSKSLSLSNHENRFLTPRFHTSHNVDSVNIPEELSRKYHHPSQIFDTWMTELLGGFNIILYGFGSKRHIIQKFVERVSVDYSVIGINGYMQRLEVSHVIDAIYTHILSSFKASTKNISISRSSNSISSLIKDLWTWSGSEIPALNTTISPAVPAPANPTVSNSKVNANINPSVKKGRRVKSVNMNNSTLACINPSDQDDNVSNEEPLPPQPYKNHLFFAINNIDGSCFRTPDAILLINRLVSLPFFHIIASVDNLCAGIIFDSGGMGGCTWIWHHSPSYAPYTFETSESDLLAECSSSNCSNVKSSVREVVIEAEWAGVESVLKALTPKDKKMFLLLICTQLRLEPLQEGNRYSAAALGAASSAGLESGLTSNDLLDLCRSSFISSNSVAFKTQLVEFEAHDLIKRGYRQDGAEVLYCPLSDDLLKKIVQKLM